MHYVRTVHCPRTTIECFERFERFNKPSKRKKKMMMMILILLTLLEVVLVRSTPMTQRDEELLNFLNRVAMIDGLGITLNEENAEALERERDTFSPTDSETTSCAVRKRSHANLTPLSTSFSSQSEEIFLQSLGTICDTRNEGYWTF